METTERFTGRAEYYAQSRPGYPRQLFDFLRERAGLGAGTVVADIGSGTGLSSAPFLEFGCRVYGVEPNAEMRAKAEKRLEGAPGFHSMDGRAEATGLGAESVDLVTAMTAFHWFDVDAARAEFTRILRPGGAVALVWNKRRMTSPLMAEYEEVVRLYGRDYKSGWGQDRRTPQHWSDLLFGSRPYGYASFENLQKLDLAGLIGRLLSASYAPLPDEPNHVAAVRRLTEAFVRYEQDGTVNIEYDTVLYYGALS